MTWQDRLSLVGVSPLVTSLSSSGWLLSPPGPPPCRGVEVEAVSEVEVDEVSRCSTSVWTADSAAPVSMWALKSTIYGLLCCSDFLQSPVLIWTPCWIYLHVKTHRTISSVLTDCSQRCTSCSVSMIIHIHILMAQILQ